MRSDAVAAAAAGAAAGGAAVYVAHRLGWWGVRRGPDLDWGAGGVSKPAAASSAAAPSLTAATLQSDPVVAEQLTRNVQFLGRAGQASLADALVVIVGLGGVGSHAAAHLLRAGVGRLRLVDFDQVRKREGGGRGGSGEGGQPPHPFPLSPFTGHPLLAQPPRHRHPGRCRHPQSGSAGGGVARGDAGGGD
jgi:hypothetical protein